MNQDSDMKDSLERGGRGGSTLGPDVGSIVSDKHGLQRSNARSSYADWIVGASGDEVRQKRASIVDVRKRWVHPSAQASATLSSHAHRTHL